MFASAFAMWKGISSFDELQGLLEYTHLPPKDASGERRHWMFFWMFFTFKLLEYTHTYTGSRKCFFFFFSCT